MSGFPEPLTPWDRAAVEQHEEHWAAEQRDERSRMAVIVWMFGVTIGSLAVGLWLVSRGA